MLAPLNLMARPDIFTIHHPLADLWVSRDSQSEVDYAYGGTRLVEPHTSDSEVTDHLRRLTLYESSIKNRLIDLSLHSGALAAYQDRLPAGFLDSRVGGARCIIRPASREVAAILTNPEAEDFHPTVARLFQELGELLNSYQGKIKLTPDFGRFAGMADILARFTPHVLGIRCEEGGCGGKSSYSSTGIIAAIEALGYGERKEEAVTLIGSAGAMGSGVLHFLVQEQYKDLALSDLAYPGAPSPAYPILPARWQTFTDACLQRGGLIIATTLGQELEHARWQCIPAHSTLLLAHNLAIPEGQQGSRLMQEMAEQQVLALPGQVLTLGGALTSRLEWFWRQAHPQQFFDKPLAHLIVRAVVGSLVKGICADAARSAQTPYEVMLQMSRREGER